MVSIKEYNNRYSPMMRTVVINRELSVNDVDNLATDLDSNGYAIKLPPGGEAPAKSMPFSLARQCSGGGPSTASTGT